MEASLDSSTMPEPTPAAEPPAVASVWPNALPSQGTVYEFACEKTGATMMAMTKDTFLAIGTQLEGYRRAAFNLDQKVKEQDDAYKALNRRHNNLREATRKARIAAAENQIVLAPANANPRGAVRPISDAVKKTTTRRRK